MSAPTALPLVTAPAAGERGKLISRVKLLSWLSLGWMTIEGAVAITAGLVASSVALVGFGLDSVIEGLASVVIIWRFTGSRALSEAAEVRAQKLVALQFFVLAPYVAFESGRTLANGDHPARGPRGLARRTPAATRPYPRRLRPRRA